MLGVQITDKTNLVYADTELYKEDVPFLIHYFIQAANRKTLHMDLEVPHTGFRIKKRSHNVFKNQFLLLMVYVNITYPMEFSRS